MMPLTAEVGGIDEAGRTRDALALARVGVYEAT